MMWLLLFATRTVPVQSPSLSAFMGTSQHAIQVPVWPVTWPCLEYHLVTHWHLSHLGPQLVVPHTLLPFVPLGFAGCSAWRAHQPPSSLSSRKAQAGRKPGCRDLLPSCLSALHMIKALSHRPPETLGTVWTVLARTDWASREQALPWGGRGRQSCPCSLRQNHSHRFHYHFYF